MMARRAIGPPRGLLNLEAGRKRFALSRHATASGVDDLVEHYWIVSWDLRGQEPYVQESLTHPSVHVVLQTGQSRIVGVVTGRFSRRLVDKGQVFGIKFKPGGFSALTGLSSRGFTNRTVGLEEILGPDWMRLEDRVLGLDEASAMVSEADRFLLARLPARHENVQRVGDIVARISSDIAITKVDDLVDAVGLGKRQLERLFNRYVGVGPKWVIQRYRIHEALERVARGTPVDWAALALDLGYFDQSHFVNDFKVLVGKTPGEYAASLGGRTVT